MGEIWESTFAKSQMMWGQEPTRSALLARDLFVASGAREILVPGIGYGRNAKPFLAAGMRVTGIEISATAIGLAGSELGLDLPIFHGSVSDMPFDDRRYDGIFCHGLVYLLDPAARAKLFADCQRQLAPGGHMIFTMVSKRAPQYGRGTRLGDDWFETHPGVQIFYYDAASLERELGAHGLIEQRELDEPGHGGSSMPFLFAVCKNA